MEKTMNFAELQELREQFKILNDKLEKQAIINDNLIQESMKQKISHVERSYKRYLLCYIIIFPMIISFLLLKGAHWGLVTFVLLTLFVEFMLYYRGYRILNPKSLMIKSYVEAVECVSVFKKRFEMITRIMFIPAILILVLLVSLVTGYTWDIGKILFYSVFVLVAWIVGLIRKRKMFFHLDEVLNKIKELRSE